MSEHWDIASRHPDGTVYVRCIAVIRKNETGEIAEHACEEMMEGHSSRSYPTPYNWEEGNFACDCNRELFFERSFGRECDTKKCSDNRFSVNLKNAKTGEIFYREFGDQEAEESL